MYDSIENENNEQSIELNWEAYEIKPEILCEACKKAHSLLHPTKEQAKQMLEDLKKLDGIFDLKPSDSLCEIVDKEMENVCHKKPFYR